MMPSLIMLVAPLLVLNEHACACVGAAPSKSKRESLSISGSSVCPFSDGSVLVLSTDDESESETCRGLSGRRTLVKRLS
jgi:hypothetical protein